MIISFVIFISLVFYEFLHNGIFCLHRENIQFERSIANEEEENNRFENDISDWYEFASRPAGQWIMVPFYIYLP